MLTKAMLDAKRCQHPGCNCGKLMLTGHCHPGAPVFLVRNPRGALITFCVVCQEPIAPVEGVLVLKSGEEFPLDDNLFYQHCHPDSPLWLFYTHNSGVVIITCAECDKEVAEVILNE